MKNVLRVCEKWLCWLLILKPVFLQLSLSSGCFFAAELYQKFTRFCVDAGAGATLAGSGGGQIKGPTAGGIGSVGRGIPAAPIWAIAASDPAKIHELLWG